MLWDHCYFTHGDETKLSHYCWESIYLSNYGSKRRHDKEAVNLWTSENFPKLKYCVEGYIYREREGSDLPATENIVKPWPHIRQMWNISITPTLRMAKSLK